MDSQPMSGGDHPLLDLFQRGAWAEAWAQFEALDESERTAEVRAAYCVMQTAAHRPGDPLPDSLTETLPATPEIELCRAWLSLPPNPTSRQVSVLVDVCRGVAWFPLWTRVLRTLVYFDQREAVLALIEAARLHPAANTSGFRLLIAEGQLECGDLALFLDGIDPDDAQPLAPAAANLWLHWLTAEYQLWTGDAVPIDIAPALRPESVPDRYSRTELVELLRAAHLFNARLDRSLDDDADTWEACYWRGLQAWEDGDIAKAQAYLEQSMRINPHQMRVVFEYDLLCFTHNLRDELPRYNRAVPDMRACLAVCHLQRGSLSNAYRLLSQQLIAPHSLRLMTPKGRRQRLYQGCAVLAQYAEARQDWQEALKLWDEARRWLPNANRNPTLRAHRLYLLSRHIQQTDANPALYAEFQRELGQLTIKTLLGDAMFYRALAAQNEKPERALADMQALVRQRRWAERKRDLDPAWLILLGDLLRAAGADADAVRVYRYLMPEGTLPPELLARFTAAQPDLLLKFAPEALPAQPLWHGLTALALLNAKPLDVSAVRAALKQGLDPVLHAVIESLLRFAAHDADAAQPVHDHLTELPALLSAALRVMCFPDDPDALESFRAMFGTQPLPVPPENTLRLKLQRGESAAEYLRQLEAVGITLAPQWYALTAALDAARAFEQGDRDGAQQLHRHALRLASRVSHDDI